MPKDGIGMQIKDSGVARIFFALWPNILVRQALSTLVKEFQSRCGARAMDADMLHMTLLYLGEVERSHIPQLTQAAGRVLTPSFEIPLSIVSFWRHNRIAYAASLVEIKTLNQLVMMLRQELITDGFMFESYEFNPHVTLLRNVEHVLDTQKITPILWRVDSFVLVESVTTNQRVRYQIIQKWPLSTLMVK